MRPLASIPSDAAIAKLTPRGRQIIGIVMDFFMRLTFYFARLIGSPHHVVSPYKAALCWTYVCLAPLPTVLSSSLTPRGPVRFGSKVTRWGKEYVGVEAFDASAPEDPRDVYGRKRWFDEARADKVMAHLDEMREKVLRAI